MKGKIAVERIYSLGDYKNIKFSDEVAEIPEEIYKNPDAMQLMRMLQLIEIENSYNRYLFLKESVEDTDIEVRLEKLDLNRSKTYELLLSQLQSIYTPSVNIIKE